MPLIAPSVESERRYRRLPVKERIMREVKRRIESHEWEFETVKWGHVIREPISDEYDGSGGDLLSMMEGVDDYTGGANAIVQAECEVLLEFCVVPGQDEDPASMLNVIAAELMEVFARDKQLSEGGTGETLAANFSPVSFEHDLDRMPDTPPRGILLFALQYRFRNGRPFSLER